MHYLVPVPKQFVDFSGLPYSGGSVSVYIHGTTDRANIYSDANTDALVSNPCELDSEGSWQAFCDADVSLDYIVQDKDGNVVGSFIDIVLPGNEDCASREYVDAQDAQIREDMASGDAENAAEIARVANRGLKIAPPEHEGVGTMLFYNGELI